jgi:hypothetical protein
VIWFVLGVVLAGLAATVLLAWRHIVRKQDRVIEEFYDQARREKAAAEQGRERGRKNA